MMKDSSGLPKVRFTRASDLKSTRIDGYELGIYTVCSEAKCPNQSECASRKTATFMILGNRCSRDCAFCAVSHGPDGTVNYEEPRLIAAMVKKLGLRHTVVTSVTRDDLPDGGADLFVQVVQEVKFTTGSTIELLIPDFRGDPNSLELIAAARPDVLNHNMETVRDLYSPLRKKADYGRALDILRFFARASIPVKSGIMVGLGETQEQLAELIGDIAETGCNALLIGQYLRPGPQNIPVRKFYSDEEFEELKQIAIMAGMKYVVAGRLVRSSYEAEKFFHLLKNSPD